MTVSLSYCLSCCTRKIGVKLSRSNLPILDWFQIWRVCERAEVRLYQFTFSCGLRHYHADVRGTGVPTKWLSIKDLYKRTRLGGATDRKDWLSLWEIKWRVVKKDFWRSWAFTPTHGHNKLTGMLRMHAHTHTHISANKCTELEEFLKDFYLKSAF